MITQLKTHRHVGGQLRSPDDGPVLIDDDLGKEFVDAGDADDVSADFPNGLQPDADAAEKTDKSAK